MADWRGPREPVPNDTIPWTPIDLRAIVPGLDDVPFGLWYYRVKSSSPDSEQLIHDPRAAMVGQVDRVTPESKVTTLVINHEKTLYYTQLHSLAVVGPDGTVTLVQWKQAG
jgi:hypothetical protein